jgi:3-phosphoshikimate 1-carboxyvinyltransferase
VILSVNQSKVLSGKVRAPSSKSFSIRGMLFSLLAKGESTLLKPLASDDTQSAQEVLESLGANIQNTPYGIKITSKGTPLTVRKTQIHTGDSGITTRFILPLLGLRKDYAKPIIINCGQQMKARPIKPLVDVLGKLGMSIQYLEQVGHLPLSVSGRLKGGVADVVEGLSSQYLSALLMGLPSAESSSVITVKNLHERPYVDMTLACLKQQEINYSHQRVDHIDIFHIPGKQHYKPIHMHIKGDFSSASYLLAATALIPGEVEIQGLDDQDMQGDKRLVTILKQMGAEVAINQNNVKITSKKPLKGIRIDANDIPDLLPTLAVIATQAIGKTEIYNVPQARIKETDRIHSMTVGLRKMGARIEENSDGIVVYQSKLKGSLVQGFNDHRTVMALTLAGMLAQGTTLITDATAINKTYPEFVKTMQAVGAEISLLTGPTRKPPFDSGLLPNLEKKASSDPIILIGFKHVGKTTIGKQLAKMLKKRFIDLDREVENLYGKYFFEPLCCRQIMQLHGELYYRQLESEALHHTLKVSSCVISLGGGTVLNQSNQDVLKPYCLLHVTAPRGIVFERIMAQEGLPSFFDPKEDCYASFSRLWDERFNVYKQLTPVTINNNNTVKKAVNEALAYLHVYMQLELSDYV